MNNTYDKSDRRGKFEGLFTKVLFMLTGLGFIVIGGAEKATGAGGGVIPMILGAGFIGLTLIYAMGDTEVSE